MTALPSLLTRLAHHLRTFTVCDRAVAAVEFALVAPTVVILFCGGSELAFFLHAHYQTAQAASTVADVITRYETLTSDNIDALLSVSSQVVGDTEFEANGEIILSSISRSSGGTPTVVWQCTGGGEYEGESLIGKAGKTATIPTNLILADDDNVIIAEVYFDYPSIFGWLPSSVTPIYKKAIFRPRLGSLTTVPGCS